MANNIEPIYTAVGTMLQTMYPEALIKKDFSQPERIDAFCLGLCEVDLTEVKQMGQGNKVDISMPIAIVSGGTPELARAKVIDMYCDMVDEIVNGGLNSIHSVIEITRFLPNNEMFEDPTMRVLVGSINFKDVII